MCSIVTVLAVRSIATRITTSVRAATPGVIVSLPSSSTVTISSPEATGVATRGGMGVTGVSTGVWYVPRITIVGGDVGVLLGVRVGLGVRVLVGVRVGLGVRVLVGKGPRGVFVGGGVNVAAAGCA